MRTRRLHLATALTGVMITGNLVQYALATLGPALIDDLGISRAAFGMLIGAYYLMAAALCGPAARLVDRVRAGPGMAGFVAVSTVATAALGFAASYPALLVCLLIAGAGAAGVNPATNRAVSDVSPPHAMLVGTKQSGAQLAALLAGVLLPPVSLAAGWRTAFMACGLIGALCLLLLAPLRLPARPRTRSRATRPLPAGIAALTGYSLLMGAGVASVSTYLPLYAHEALGLSAGTAGLSIAIVGCCSAVARIGWSLVAERGLWRLSGSTGVLLVIAALSVTAVCVLATASTVGAPMLWVAAMLLGASATAWNSVVMLAVIRELPATAVARASARVQAAFFTGLALSPAVFGWLVDATGGYLAGWALTGTCFAAAGLVLLSRR